MRVLLAGGTGVLGRSVLPKLLAAGHEVVAVSRQAETDRRLEEAGASPVRLDLFDADAATEVAAREGVDAVVNLATNVPVGNAAMRRRAWETHERLRRDASRALATAAIGTLGARARFVQESFAPTYPDRGDAWIDEDVPLEPYAQTTTVPDAEASARSVTAAGGVGVALRFGLFYGPGRAAGLLEAARGGRLMLPGRPDAYASMVHVDDAAAAVVAALSVPAGVYNVVEDEPVTRAEHARILAELLDVPRVRHLPVALSYLPMLRVVSRSQRVSNARLVAAAGWRPQHPGPRSGWRAVLESMEHDRA